MKIFALVLLKVMYTCPDICTVYTEFSKEYIQFRSRDTLFYKSAVYTPIYLSNTS